MNNIILFTDSKIPLKHFGTIEKSPKWNFDSLAQKDLRKRLKAPQTETIYILDYDSISEDEKAKNLNYFLKKDDIPRIVIDRKNSIADPAEQLMKGCDYIGGDLLKSGIKPARLIKYTEFFTRFSAPPSLPEDGDCIEPEKQTSDYIISENGWKDIKSGKKYSFYMLFTEITLPSSWKKKSGSVHLNKLKQTFQSVAEKTATQDDGKVWIWNEYGGLILFPYDGNSSSAVISGIKLMLNRVLISIEDFNLHTPIRLKVSMHLGTTTWKARGKTGTIISDSLNSIFHLGTKYTPLNEMDITEEVYNELPAGIQKMFTDAGTFEDRRIFRLCHFKVIN